MVRLALLALVASVSACAPNVPESAPEAATVRLLSGAEVTVPDYMGRCETDSACTLVGTGCDYCCQTQAINGAFEDRYEAEFEEACASYSGGWCDCVAAPEEARCVNQKCESVASLVEPIR